MTWWQLSLLCTTAELEHTESVLLEQGALSMTLADAGDEPIYEPLPGNAPVWRNTVVTALFDSSHTPAQRYDRLSADLPDHLMASVQQNLLQDQDWLQTYRDHFSPIQCGSKLWIVPSWCDVPDLEATNIVLDPGLAFGTGGHETTALCLDWMSENNIQGKTMIDYGCGSGILAITACKLGARRALGVDIDPQALIASRHNAERNALGKQQLMLALPEQMDQSAADLLIANILAEPLIDLAPKLAGYVKPGGYIVLSGILRQQANSIERVYQAFFELGPVCAKGDWVRIVGRCRHD